MKLKSFSFRKLQHPALQLALLVTETNLPVSAPCPHDCARRSSEYPFLSPSADGTGNTSEEFEPGKASGGRRQSVYGVHSCSLCTSRGDNR